MAVACAPLAAGWEIGGGPGPALGGLFFTEAELAAADLLVQLSGSGSGGGDGAGAAPGEPESPRSVNTCAGGAAARAEEALGLEIMDDRRARKRYRMVSELYDATRPVVVGAGCARKRKRGQHPEAEVAMRYGDQRFFLGF